MTDKVEIFSSEKIKLFVSKFGQLTDEKSGQCCEVQKYTWETTNRLTFEVITLDAAIVGIRPPDKDFNSDEVILGSGTLKAYLYYASQNLSSSIQSAPLKRRTDWGQRIWSPYVNGSDLILTNVVLDDCCNLMIQVRFSVSFNNVVRIGYQVVSDKARLLETTHRLVLNLGGGLTGYCGMYDHVVQLNAEGFYRAKGNTLRDNVTKSMAEDLVDLRVAQHVGMAIYRSDRIGFNGVYRLSEPVGMVFNTRLIQARNRRVMEIYSDFNWMRFSTLDDLPELAGRIGPFYASLGIRNVEQIFNIDQLVHSVVRFVEGDDLESGSMSSVHTSDTMGESEMRFMIDDLFLKDLEDKIQALKEVGLLSMKEAREIIIDLIIMSLDCISVTATDSNVLDEEGVRTIIEELILKAVYCSSVSIVDSISQSTTDSTVIDEGGVRKVIDDLILKALPCSTVLSTSANDINDMNKDISREEVLNEYQKHGGILLQLTETPFLRTCKKKSVFSLPNRIRESPRIVYEHSVFLKFGLCKIPSNDRNKSISAR
ncbi:uncharacterized protein LOC131679487 [Topomyia yanbarensis]|uniref:uncharacterized protein LOC131679487 n=1 Tax=Topomyia yanbarensis TaxID=2498891 RepID=UPI00273A83B6|nr:uncharacterized protein LOC131679487 [Topomyia yanbarensis]